MLTPQQIGGRIMAERQHHEAIHRYLQNPNVCPQCHTIILPKEGATIQSAKKKQFCSSKCFAIYTNTRRIKKPISHCISCQQPITNRTKTKMCLRCYHQSVQALIIPITTSTIPNTPLTKGDLKNKRGSYQSYRSAIRVHAQKIFEQSQRLKACAICGYTHHIDIAHKKSVSKFSDNTTITEINNIDNLVPLCPNHHWEYDHGMLKLVAGLGV